MKHVTYLILAICIAVNVYSQENKYSVGLEGSPSIIFLRGNAIGNNYSDPGIGFSGGLTFQYNFSKVFSVRTNIAYERKGSRVVATVLDGNGTPSGQTTQHLNFDYLTVPFLLRATFGKKVNFFVNVGAFLGYLIKQTDTYDTTVKGLVYSVSDNTSSYNRFDAGIAIGLGLTVPIKEKILLSFESRNNTGLYNIDKPSVINSPTLKTSSTNLLIGLAYKFNTHS